MTTPIQPTAVQMQEALRIVSTWYDRHLHASVATAIDGDALGRLRDMVAWSLAESAAGERALAPELAEALRTFVDAYKDHPERLGTSSAAQRHFTAARALLARIDGEG